MKRIILAAIAVLVAINAVGTGRTVKETTTPASDSRITWVGRTLKTGSDVSFDWSGVYARISFEGCYFAMRASDSNKNYYNVWIDKDMAEAPDKIIRTQGKDSLIVIFNESEIKAVSGRNPATRHNLIIQKRTEGSQGRTTIHSFITKGQILQAGGLKSRQIEFIGDSYTCGYGSENSKAKDPFTPETENCNKSYAPIVARFFDADFAIVAHSGMGIARNYNDANKDNYMPDRYLQTFDMDSSVKWIGTDNDFRPQISVIYLGTNDFSVKRQPSIKNFRDNYIRLINSIKANYGDEHPVLCVGSRIDELMYYYLKEVVSACGMHNVSYMVFSEKIHNDDTELGASWHPNYKGHIKKAFAVIPYISTITGWDIETEAVR